jgi:hypothetical protein
MQRDNPKTPEGGITMAAKSDDLIAAVKDFDASVDRAGDPALLERALARLESVVQRHANVLRHPDDLIGAVDRPRIPSPGMDRDISHLHDQLEALLRDIRALAGWASAPGESRSMEALSALRWDAHRLSEELAQYWDREAHVILETVNMDIGAGD